MNHSHSASGSPTTSGGCGCGGYSGHSCSCVKPGCQECKTPALVRPRFFAGQLLTEEDLEALTTYVVAKQRLHTRHLHGDGVVCGLEVVCHPCGGGKVIVQPGYALDCCGNDILVPCPSDLDILAMIRRLVIDKRGGHDCGDPCEESKLKGAGRKTNGRSTSLAGAAATDDDKTREPLSARYCLYLHYCEQEADPVKPYVLEEPCGSAGCEHTRVREGYRFELRCADEADLRPTFLDRLKACSDPDELKKEIGSATKRAFRYHAAEAALHAARQDEPIRFVEGDLDRFSKNSELIGRFVERFGGEKEGEPAPADRDLREALDAYVDLARVTARAQAVEAAGERLPGNARERIIGSRAALEALEPIARRHVNVFELTEEQLTAQAALDQGLRWTTPDLALEERKSAEARLFLAGAMFSSDLSKYDVQQLAQLRDWLLRRVESGVQTDCRLHHDVEAIRVDASNWDPEALAAARRRLESVLERYIAACFCAAILPPCPPCEDPGVLLACLTVEECEVVDICNLERTFVLSWPLMRYWVPWFGELGELFEKLCCPAPLKKPEIVIQPGILNSLLQQRTNNVFSLAGEADRQLVQRSTLESALRFAVTGPESSGAIARLTQVLDRSVVPGPGDLPLALETAATPGGEQLAKALQSPAPRQAIDDMIADRVNVLRPSADLTAIADTVEEKLTDMTATIAGVRKDLKRRPTVTELTEVKAIKRLVTNDADLKDVSRKLEKSNQDLAARVAELTRRLDTLETRQGHA